MGHLSDEQRKYHLARVRDVIIRKPDVSILEIQRVLDADRSPLHLSENYIAKIAKKVHTERTHRRNYHTRKYTAMLEDELSALKPFLWQIVQTSKLDVARIAAAGKIAEFTEKLKELNDIVPQAQNAVDITNNTLNIFPAINSPRTMKLLQETLKEIESTHETAVSEITQASEAPTSQEASATPEAPEGQVAVTGEGSQEQAQ
jgi:hypothetical protein